ncbi:MAG: hypothetical protein WAW33_02330 [Minisyncoccia bacterium]
MGFIKRLFKGLIIIFIIVILVLGYLGFVPGISAIFGSNKPQDLGIKYTEEALQSIAEKNKVKRIIIDQAPNIKSSFILEGSQEVNNSFTSEEITARLGQESDWPLNPFTDVQVKIGENGIVEASGIVRVNRLKDYAEVTGVSQKDIETISKEMDKYKIPRISFPAYVRGTISINNNRLDINLSELKVGRISLSQKLYSQAKKPFESFVYERLTSGGYGSLFVRSLNFSNGKMNFSGNLPQIITTAKTILGD